MTPTPTLKAAVKAAIEAQVTRQPPTMTYGELARRVGLPVPRGTLQAVLTELGQEYGALVVLDKKGADRLPSFGYFDLYHPLVPAEERWLQWHRDAMAALRKLRALAPIAGA